MQKTIKVDGLDRPVTIARRKGTRNIRISIKNSGEVRLTVPYGVPELFAKKFLVKKIDWILQHQPSINEPLLPDAHIGKSHRLRIDTTEANRHSTRINGANIIVKLPKTYNITDQESQKIISKACEKALLLEATNLLPQRLAFISEKTHISYKSCTIKKLKSRWGACDNLNNISLNSFLIQLDWRLIDYVIYHELAHTHHHHHQKEFWTLVSKICPSYKSLRKELHSKPTIILPTLY